MYAVIWNLGATAKIFKQMFSLQDLVFLSVNHSPTSDSLTDWSPYPDPEVERTMKEIKFLRFLMGGSSNLQIWQRGDVFLLEEVNGEL